MPFCAWCLKSRFSEFLSFPLCSHQLRVVSAEKKKIIPLNETISWVLGSKICFKSKSSKVGPITWHFYFLSFSTPLFGLNILDGGVIMILGKRKGEINLEFKWNKGFGFFACYGRREFILQAMLFCFFYFEKVSIILLIVSQ